MTTGIAERANSEPLHANLETMRYRPLGRTGLQVSALAMGCMRLGADQELNTRLISRAIDLGVNYFETTRFYCGGQCQNRVAPGLKGRTRGLIVSGKNGIGPDTTASLFRKEIERQLEALGLDHFKFFQVGWFGWDRVRHLLKPGGVLDALRQAQREGLVHHIGFTGHDKPENFIKCIETGLFDCITVPYNLINRTYEPTIQRAGELGVGVIAMCPVSGGVLAFESPKMREALGLDLPTPEMALRFVLSNPDISAACSGMNTLEQLEQNVRTVKQFEPSQEAFQTMSEAVDRLRQTLGTAICTTCRYCVPCPQGVEIPLYMAEYTNWRCFGLDDWVRGALKRVPPEKSLNRCKDCEACEKKCPNHLPIRQRFKELRETFELQEAPAGQREG
jgi:predicted aldo/keto reductase-like oxidoreductase